MKSLIDLCFGKTAHETRWHAVQHLEAMRRRYRRQHSTKPSGRRLGRRQVYHCPACGYWHIGSRAPKSKRRRMAS